MVTGCVVVLFYVAAISAQPCLKSKGLIVSERWKEITVDNVLERSPLLRDNMQPVLMARIIGDMPIHLRQELAMVVYTVIDGKVIRVDCFSRKCSSFKESKTVRDFVDQFAEQMSIKDLYFVTYNRGEIHFEIAREAVSAYAQNKASFEKAFDHTCDLVLQLPALRPSIDLGEGLLEHNHFLIPNAYMLKGFQPKSVGGSDDARKTGQWESNKEEARTASRNTPWDRKISKVFWRGTDSGKTSGATSNQGRVEIPKYTASIELTRMSAQQPDKIDAKYTHRSPDEIQIKQLGVSGMEDQFVTKLVTITDYVKFKYLISLDDEAVSWMRVPEILSTNCVLLKQETLKVEWFDYALKPYVHYYPVKRDLSDLLEAIDYLEKHQEEAQEIIRNANRFVQEYFTREKITEAAKRVFRDYAQIQNYTFNQVERQLILQWNQPYYTFGPEPWWLQREQIKQFRIWKILKYVCCGLSIFAVLLYIAKCKRISKRFKRLSLQQTQQSQELSSTVCIAQPDVIIST